jgi:hypothetical protein
MYRGISISEATFGPVCLYNDCPLIDLQVCQDRGPGLC